MDDTENDDIPKLLRLGLHWGNNGRKRHHGEHERQFLSFYA